MVILNKEGKILVQLFVKRVKRYTQAKIVLIYQNHISH